MWAIPYEIALLYADGLVLIVNSFMKCFNYIWYNFIVNFLSNLILVSLSYYLGYVKKMGVRGVMTATLSYLVIFVPINFYWMTCVLDVDSDIRMVTFEEENKDDHE